MIHERAIAHVLRPLSDPLPPALEQRGRKVLEAVRIRPQNGEGQGQRDLPVHFLAWGMQYLRSKKTGAGNRHANEVLKNAGLLSSFAPDRRGTLYAQPFSRIG